MSMKSFIQHLQERSLLAPMMLSAALGAGTPPEAPQPTEQPVQQTEPAKKPAWHGLISGSEGIRTKAYWDEDGKAWTIGKGSTTHPSGAPVKQGDVIKPEQADEYMEHYVNKKFSSNSTEENSNLGQIKCKSTKCIDFFRL